MTIRRVGLPRRHNAWLSPAAVMRVGVPKRSGKLCFAAFNHDLPTMVSASAFWDARKRSFAIPFATDLEECDWALDSAGFTAMLRWKQQGRQPGMLGIYPWSLEDYLDLVIQMQPRAWYAQPDCCVEPELAPDRAAVEERIYHTAVLLAANLEAVRLYQEAGVHWLPPPVPVLQGWTRADYLLSLNYLIETWNDYGASFAAPVLVGMGSMCRRDPDDPEFGIMAILDAVLPRLPRGIRLHMFGVKGSVMARLASIPQIASYDSMAWDFGARREAHRTGLSNTNERRISAMVAWHHRHAVDLQSQTSQRPYKTRRSHEAKVTYG